MIVPRKYYAEVIITTESNNIASSMVLAFDSNRSRKLHIDDHDEYYGTVFKVFIAPKKRAELYTRFGRKKQSVTGVFLALLNPVPNIPGCLGYVDLAFDGHPGLIEPI